MISCKISTILLFCTYFIVYYLLLFYLTVGISSLDNYFLVSYANHSTKLYEINKFIPAADAPSKDGSCDGVESFRCPNSESKSSSSGAEKVHLKAVGLHCEAASSNVNSNEFVCVSNEVTSEPEANNHFSQVSNLGLKHKDPLNPSTRSNARSSENNDKVSHMRPKSVDCSTNSFQVNSECPSIPETMQACTKLSEMCLESCNFGSRSSIKGIGFSVSDSNYVQSNVSCNKFDKKHSQTNSKSNCAKKIDKDPDISNKNVPETSSRSIEDTINSNIPSCSSRQISTTSQSNTNDYLLPIRINAMTKNAEKSNEIKIGRNKENSDPDSKIVGVSNVNHLNVYSDSSEKMPTSAPLEGTNVNGKNTCNTRTQSSLSERVEVC